MPRRPGAIPLSGVQLTREQHDALKAEAERQGVTMSELVRGILAEKIPGFLQVEYLQPGKYKRRPDKQILRALKKAGWRGNDEQAKIVVPEVWEIIQRGVEIGEAVEKWADAEYGIGEE